MAPPKTADLIAEVNKSISDLVDVVRSINERVGKLETKPIAPENVVGTEPVKEVLVPQEYRDLVDRWLNKRFGVRIAASVNPMEFIFSILVPKEYSSASDGHWQMYHEDARQTKIEVILKDTQLKEHCEKVFNSFDPSIQGLIIADRRLNE